MKLFIIAVLCVATYAPVCSYQANTGLAGRKVVSAQTSSLSSTRVIDTSATTTFPSDSSMPYNPPNYWFNIRIHSFGNTGFFGGLHAALAPLATMLIDAAAYDGKNIRQTVCEGLRDYVGKPNARIADLCSGVGISTRALQGAFTDAESINGLDTSPEMIAMAEMLSSDNLLNKIMKSFKDDVETEEQRMGCKPTFRIANAEKTGLPPASFDLVTIMYAFHEAPSKGRDRMLKEARRLLKEGTTLAVVDISPNYEPSPSMLAGEPYVLEYQKNIDTQLRETEGFEDVYYKEVIPGHVSVWVLTKTGSKLPNKKPAFLTSATGSNLKKMKSQG